jgi:prephenate dehydrogenase
MMTSVLFQNNISIKDIELLKMREGTGGTIRLSFDSDAIATEAKSLIESIGFRTR